MTDTKPCFVIAPIGDSESSIRKRSDQVLKHIIRPAVEECGYSAVRADEIDRPGLITSQVIQRVVSDPLVIADLTDRNPNVFYELAIRHAIRKPLVQIIKKGERIPFDVANQRTVQVDHHDLDSVDAARKEIVAQVKSLEADPTELETPISVSLDLQMLRQSEDPEERSLAELVSVLTEVRSGLAKVEAKLGAGDEDGVLEQIQFSLSELPERIQEFGEVGRLRRKHRLYPGAIRELAHLTQGRSRGPGGPIGILIVASLVKDDFPWLYELGLEAYRKASRGHTKAAEEAVAEFRETMDLTLRGPYLRDLGASHSDYLFAREELPFLLKEAVELWRSSKG
ncbi:MAG: hypothetical protein AAF481_19000 [Acidobacteriota bacterium]